MDEKAGDIAPRKARPITKLRRLPKAYKVTKRPLQRPTLPSPFAGAHSSRPKVVLISARTPFMSAVKRVLGLLKEVEKRAAQGARARERVPATAPRSKGGKKAAAAVVARTDDSIAEAADAAVEGRHETEEGKEEVVVQAAGRSIEKALNVGLFLKQRHGLKLNVRTGTVTAVDDIEYRPDANEAGEGDGNKEDDETIPDARLRYVSCIKIGVSFG